MAPKLPVRVSSRLLALAAVSSAACGAPQPPPAAPTTSPAASVQPAPLNETDARAEALLGRMTLEEKLAYVGGVRDFYIRAVPRLGIPEIKLADGPMGVRTWGPSTAYPATVGLAATFDSALASRMGKAIARDARARGVHVLLAPAVNIQRSPLTGRNFEYMGEDPYLAGRIATEFVKGVQGEGVLATVKHFAANNQEWDRNHVSSEVDERTLREIYLPAFETVVREGRVGSVMSAYNLLNGIYCSHHPWLLKTVLKQEWGFRGFVMSDWVAVHDPLGGALGGCDLEMPRAEQMNPVNLRALLDAGTFTGEELDEKVRRILRTVVGAGFLEREQKQADIPLDDPASAAVALEVARKSLVLLKNESGVLPLDPAKLKTIAVVGPNAHPAVHSGAGAAHVTPFHAVSVKDGIAAALPNARLLYHPGIQQRTQFSAMAAPVFSGPVKEELFRGRALEGSPVVTRTVDRVDFDPADGVAPAPGLDAEHYSIRWSGVFEAPKAAQYAVMTHADDGIRVFIDGRTVLDDWSDHAPRTKVETVKLPAGRHTVVVEYFQGILGAIAQFGIGPAIDGDTSFGAKELEAVVGGADAVVLCLGFSQSAETNSASRKYDGHWPSDWPREASLVEAEASDRSFSLPEPQLETLRRVTQKNPRTIVVLNAGGGVALDAFERVPGLLWAWYPGQEGGTAVADVLFGKENPSGKLPITLARRYEDHPSAPYYNLNHGGKTPYTEGLLVGYRGFDAAGVAPAFPFGFGLSYTAFEYSDPEVTLEQDGSVRVSAAIINTGSRVGEEVVEVYVAPPPGQQRPPQKLEGYARVSLAPGEKKRVTLRLPPRAFAYWSDGWVVDAGRYEVRISASSRDPKLTKTIELGAAKLGR